MITLLTGGPGTGKTAWLLNALIDHRKEQPDRLIYIHGIRNLRGIAHETIYCRSQLCDICRSQDADIQASLKNGLAPKFVEDWMTWKESGALIIVDEVQRIWRPSNGAAQLPESISGLETHRHYGLDFWLISQGPHLFHNFIRLLVGRHVHLVAKWNGRSEYEWPECKQDVQSRSDAIVRPYTLPKRVFDMYDSAEIHTKQDKRRPLSFYAAIASLLVLAILVVALFYRLKARIHPQPDPVAASSTLASAVPGSPPSASSPAPVKPIFPDFQPTVPGVPESAPAYAELIKVTAAPLLAGCVYSKAKDSCLCYTAQATPYPVSKPYCIEQVKNHRFNPYLQPKVQHAADNEHNEHNEPIKQKPIILGSRSTNSNIR